MVLREQFFVGSESGLTRAQLRWGEKQGRHRRVGRDVYRLGGHDPTRLDRAIGNLIAANGVASGRFAGYLHELDSVPFGDEVTIVPFASTKVGGQRHRWLDAAHVTEVGGLPCTDGYQTLVDLAAPLDDRRWEHALESALRKNLVTIAALEAELPTLGAARTKGVRRIRRVLALRPRNAPPTGSLLETLMVQLIRDLGLPEPRRQLIVWDEEGRFVAQVDLCWPELGLFIELDGEHHKGQPVYDANRETAVVATTGWLCGRFTWTEVVNYATSTGRRLASLLDQARLRPVRSELQGGRSRAPMT